MTISDIYWTWIATIDPASFWLGVGFTSGLWAVFSPRRRLPRVQGYQWNRPEVLPPVDCPLVLRLGSLAVRAERVSYLRDRAGDMDYRLSDGSVISGRYHWSYP